MRTARSPLRASVRQNAVRTTVRLGARKASRTAIFVRVGALASSVAFIILLGAWLWHIGWPQKQARRVADFGLHLTQEAHFAVKDIVVEGRAQTSRQAIFAALGIDGGAPILGFDPRAAEARLMQLPWVASATVERRLPDGIVVHLIERVPLARWQHDNQTVVIDADGQPLPQASLARFADLPLVVGSGAPEASAGLLQALKDYPAITKMMTAAVRVSGRRWDFHMEPGVVVRMPAGDLLEGLERLATLIAKQGILSHAVTVIDLRLPDRMIFEPSAAAVAAAKATAKAGKANKGPARP